MVVRCVSKVNFVLQPFYSVLLAYFVKSNVKQSAFYYPSNVILIAFESADGRLKLREQYAPLYERLSFTFNLSVQETPSFVFASVSA